MNMQNIMAQARKIQGEMERITKEIESTTFTYKNDNVLIEASGKNKITKIEILNEEVLKDKEILEDLLYVGINDVLNQIKKVKEDKLGKYTGGMGGLF
ncbi:MAG: YbaB/EbfC family nucleoid-associated protein [Bacilli bacterium]|nr:YbaB/EbfC family nucleoid-associated protein [Bacilli bacterium]